MVNHDQKGIEAGREGQIGDKIAGKLLEGTRCGQFDGRQWRYSGVGVGFVLLAGCAALDITADKGGEAWPPEFGSDKLAGFKKARVAGGFVIMTAGKDGAAEGVISGYVDVAFVGEDARVYLPVSEMGAEWKGNIFVHGLECL